MEKEKILNFLNKYSYEYVETNQKIIVNLDFAQKIYIDFSDANKVKITDKLTGWNFLTGLIVMSLKNAMIYNFVGALLIGLLFIFTQMHNSVLNLTAIYLVFMLWVLMFTFYYLIKLESFTTRIMNLHE